MKNKRIVIENLNKLIGEKFGNYSKYIIQERALPDLRDGLKPVQRRILFSMNDLKLFNNSPYKKSARVVGDVIGKYHPHGDSSVYEAMVRMSQEWKMNVPLIDMHGNKGSIDGDSAAAMRYTEARLSKISSYMLANIKKNIIKYSPNFDDSELEPTILPTIFPNILINGSVGIASGYSTNLPPHNFTEVIKALIYVLRNEDYTLSSILKYIKGPDFPTGGLINGKDEIKNMYRTGKGKITLQAKYDYNEKENIINITEIPFESNKSEIVRKIDELISLNKIPKLSFVRDDSDRNGMSIILKLKSKVDPKLIMAYLFKTTDLQKRYSANFVAIRNKKPELLSLLDIFSSFKDFQIKIYRNLYKYELEKVKKRLEIVEALMVIVDVIDEVIRLIRKSLNKSDAKKRIIERFKFNDNQAEAIVNLRLYRLTSTDILELREEHNQLLETIKHYEKCLNDNGYLIIQIVNNLEVLLSEFKIRRKSIIVNEDDGDEIIEVDEKDLIEEEEVYIGVSRDGYIKKVSIRSKESSNKEDYGLREGDFDLLVEHTTNINNVFLFTSSGRYYSIPIYKLKQSKWKEFGEHASVYTSISGNEKIVRIIIGKKINRGKFIVVTTKNGLVKRGEVKNLVIPNTKSGAKFIGIKKDDEVVSISFMKSDNWEIVSVTSFGFLIKYDLNSVPITGNGSSGVKNISLIEKDYVVKSLIFDSDEIDNSKEQVCFLTNKAKLKRIRVSDIKLTKRGGKGIRLLKEVKSYKEHLINMFDPNRIKVIKIFTNKNKYLKISPKKMVLLSDLNSGFSNPLKVTIIDAFEVILHEDINFEYTHERKVNIKNKLDFSIDDKKEVDDKVLSSSLDKIYKQDVIDKDDSITKLLNDIDIDSKKNESINNDKKKDNDNNKSSVDDLIKELDLDNLLNNK